MSSVLAVLGEQGGGLMPTVSLVLALALFVSIVAWVFVVPKSSWQRDAEIPLDDARVDARKENRHD
jgi:hypothetical protein